MTSPGRSARSVITDLHTGRPEQTSYGLTSRTRLTKFEEVDPPCREIRAIYLDPAFGRHPAKTTALKGRTDLQCMTHAVEGGEDLSSPGIRPLLETGELARLIGGAKVDLVEEVVTRAAV